MNARLPLRPVLVACSALLAFNTAVASTPAGPSTSVAVHPTHYAFDGRGYADLNALESSVRTSRPSAIAVTSCGAAAARAWMAAVHRFNDLPLRIDFANMDEAACGAVPVALPIGLRAGEVPSGIDDAAVRRYWEQVAP